jgi:hypothetical protein
MNFREVKRRTELRVGEAGKGAWHQTLRQE